MHTVESREGILACRSKQYFNYRRDYNLNFHLYFYLTYILCNYNASSWGFFMSKASDVDEY
jgi:hypothetical protein